jgi:hypothetical protein
MDKIIQIKLKNSFGKGSLTIVGAHHMYSMPPYPYCSTTILILNFCFIGLETTSNLTFLTYLDLELWDIIQSMGGVMLRE